MIYQENGEKAKFYRILLNMSIFSPNDLPKQLHLWSFFPAMVFLPRNNLTFLSFLQVAYFFCVLLTDIIHIQSMFSIPSAATIFAFVTFLYKRFLHQVRKVVPLLSPQTKRKWLRDHYYSNLIVFYKVNLRVRISSYINKHYLRHCIKSVYLLLYWQCWPWVELSSR